MSDKIFEFTSGKKYSSLEVLEKEHKIIKKLQERGELENLFQEGKLICIYLTYEQIVDLIYASEVALDGFEEIKKEVKEEHGETELEDIQEEEMMNLHQRLQAYMVAMINAKKRSKKK